jgi:hypothetical protein
MTRAQQAISRIALTMMSTGLTLVIVAVVFLFGPELESKYFPVLTGWKPTEWHTDRNDIVVTGLMYKRRNCSYIPPQAAVDSNGGHYLVSTPNSPRSWVALNQAQKFGPWRIHEAAGQNLTFYTEHQCHPAWPVISVLGTLNASGVE